MTPPVVVVTPAAEPAASTPPPAPEPNAEVLRLAERCGQLGEQVTGCEGRLTDLRMEMDRRFDQLGAELRETVEALAVAEVEDELESEDEDEPPEDVVALEPAPPIPPPEEPPQTETKPSFLTRLLFG